MLEKHLMKAYSCLVHHDYLDGLGHETVAVLLPGFAINW